MPRPERHPEAIKAPDALVIDFQAYASHGPIAKSATPKVGRVEHGQGDDSAILRSATLTRVTLTTVKLTRVTLTRVTLTRVRLKRVGLTRVGLTRVRLTRVGLTRV